MLLQLGINVRAQHSADVSHLIESLHDLSGSERISALHKLSAYERFRNIDKAFVYANEAVELTRDSKMDSLKFESFFHLGNINILQGDYSSAINFLTDAHIGFNKLEVLNREMVALNSLASVYSEIGQFYKAIDIYFKTLDYGIQMSVLPYEIHSLMRIGILHQELNNYDTSKRYLKEAVAKAKSGDSWRNGSLAMVELGNLENTLGNKDTAAFHYQEAINWLRNKKSIHSIPALLSNIGDIYKDQEKLKEALEAKKEAIALADSLNNSVFAINGLVELAIIQRMLGDFEGSLSSLENASDRMLNTSIVNTSRFNALNLIAENYYLLGDYKKSAEFAYQSYRMALENESWAGAEKGLEILTEANIKLNRLQDAIENQKELLGIRDSIINEERIKNIQEFDAIYSLSKKEQEIALLEVESEQRKIIQTVLIAGVLGILVIAFLIIRIQYFRIQRRDIRLENEELKRKELQKDLDFKNKQLVTKSLNILQKKELILDMKEKVQKFRDEGSIRELSKLSNQIDYSFSLDKDWDDFKLYFEEVHINFYNTLKTSYNDLTPNELKLSALIKLNFSSKEMADILGISPDSVKKARYRLRKKLGLSKDDNLVDFMLEIEKQSLSLA